MKINKIKSVERDCSVKGQDPYYQHLPNNGKPYDPNQCGNDCIQYNYFYGTDDTAVPSQQQHCILYDEYVSAQTWLFW